MKAGRRLMIRKGIEWRLVQIFEKSGENPERFRRFWKYTMRWVRWQMPDEKRRGEEKRDFFRESLSDFSFFADIPNVRNQSRTADDTKKWRFF